MQKKEKVVKRKSVNFRGYFNPVRQSENASVIINDPEEPRGTSFWKGIKIINCI